MKAQIPPQLINEAFEYLLLCEGGLDLESDLPAWADSWIMRMSHIPDPLYYLSTSIDKSPPDIWSALRELGMHHQADIVRVSFLKKLLALLNEKSRSAIQIAHALAEADHIIEHPEDNWTRFALDFSAMDHAPITEEEITDKMRTWLSKSTK